MAEVPLDIKKSNQNTSKSNGKETEELYKSDVKVDAAINDANKNTMKQYENWDLVVDDFSKVIQNSFKDIVNEFTGSKDYFQCDEFMKQESKTEIVSEIQNEIIIKTHVEQSNMLRISLPHKRTFDLSKEFFKRIWVNLCSCLTALKSYHVVNDIKMVTKSNNEKETKKVKHLKEEAHVLETIISTYQILMTEKQDRGAKIKNSVSNGNSFTYCDQVQQTSRNILPHIINDLLGRHDIQSLSYYRIPHIHQITLQQDSKGTITNSINNEEQIKQTVGDYHAEWKKKIREGNFSNPSCLYDYLIESEECRINEPTNYFPVFDVIEKFIEEYGLELKKIKHKKIKQSLCLENKFPKKRENEKQFDYYPHCYFCGQHLFDMENNGRMLKKDYCCANAKLINLVKKKITLIKTFSREQLTASWKKSTLKKIAETAENLRIKILIEEGQRFLYDTAQKMNLSYGEVAKLLLAVAIGQQKKKEDNRLEIDYSESFYDDPGEGIVGKKVEPLWRKVIEFSEEPTQPDILDERGDYVQGLFKTEKDDISDQADSQSIKKTFDAKTKDRSENLKEKDGGIEKLNLRGAYDKESGTYMKGKKEKEMKLTKTSSEKSGQIERKGKSKKKSDQSSESDGDNISRKEKKKSSQKYDDGTKEGKTSKRKIKHEGQEENYSSKESRKKTNKDKSLKKGKKVDGPTSKDSRKKEKGKSSGASSVSLRKQIEKAGGNTFAFIPYCLSDAKYDELGWSNIPPKYHLKKVTVNQTKQRKGNFLWCKEGLTEEVHIYPDGSVFSVMRDDGTGEIFYPDGKPAIIVTKEEKRITVTVFSEDEKNPDEICVVGKFDSYGHGIIYNSEGKIRLQFTQSWGLYNDLESGKTMKWTWGIVRKNNFDRHIYEKKKHMLKSDAEFQHYSYFSVNENSKSVTKNPYCPIPFLIINLNSIITFRIFEQDSMCLILNTKMSWLRLELGIVVDPFMVAFSESYIDHDLEKENKYIENMNSIHDKLLPPQPALPDSLPLPASTCNFQERKYRSLVLHRAIKVNAQENNQSKI